MYTSVTSVDFTPDELDMQDAEILPTREALGIFDGSTIFGPNVNVKVGVLTQVGVAGGNLSQTGAVLIG
ncbi:hypothetical protein [Kitasatospora camelliae]|uniref:Uncharacterized protein n=1 Tax=Kitasatospora camelliae TaxID=3156397 RepID=A0AAU8K6Y9_9ACTN